MFPAFPAHAQPAILRIWQEAHGRDYHMFHEIYTVLKFLRNITFAYLKISCEETIMKLKRVQIHYIDWIVTGMGA